MSHKYFSKKAGWTKDNNLSLLVTANIVILITYIILIDLLFLADAVRFASRHKLWEDEYSVYEKKFECVKGSIPPDAVVGYVSSSTTNYGYNLSQYALAPNIIVNDADMRYVLGNFDDTTKISELNSIKGLSLIKNCGNGVALFKREIK